MRQMPHAARRPRQRGRIIEIIANLTEGIKEAELNGWLGDVAGLKTTREAAAKNLPTSIMALLRPLRVRQ